MADDPASTGIDRITIIPDVCNGKPTIRGLRITVATILGYLASGDSVQDILDEFSFLEPEDISACLAFASQIMERKYAVHQVR